MNADQIRECLARRWPDSEYLCIPEAPYEADQRGRKIDLLVISLWRSRGLQIEAVEIKVSMHDWKRELLNAEKADFWWRHSSRFWLAVPAVMAEKVKPDLPATWGLLACEFDTPTRVVVKAPTHPAESLSWAACVGLLRAASSAGLNALNRAYDRGERQGMERAKRDAELRGPDGAAAVALEQLRERVQRFEAASGISIAQEWDAGRLGELVALLRREQRDPTWLIDHLGQHADAAINSAKRLQEEAKKLKDTANRIAGLVADARNGNTA